MDPIPAAVLLLGLLCFTGISSAQDTYQGNKFDSYSQPIPGSDISIEMVPVPGGTFRMGSPENESGRSADEGPLHEVRIEPFWMGKYEITWEQYEYFAEEKIENLVKNENPASDKVSIEADALSQPTPPYVDMSFGMGKDGKPAINMTQYAAQMFAKWLSVKTGRFYRLPTEAEWEYACRAGTQTVFYFGDNPENLDSHAWYKGNSEGKYGKVGAKKPNAWNLFDMHGNVAEWTMDQFKPDYYNRFEDSTAVNPWAKPKELYPRTVRGGSWQDEPSALRCAERLGSDSSWKQRDPQFPKSLWWHTNAPFVGFRLVRPQIPPQPGKIEEYWFEAIKDY